MHHPFDALAALPLRHATQVPKQELADALGPILFLHEQVLEAEARGADPGRVGGVELGSVIEVLVRMCTRALGGCTCRPKAPVPDT